MPPQVIMETSPELDPVFLQLLCVSQQHQPEDFNCVTVVIYALYDRHIDKECGIRKVASQLSLFPPLRSEDEWVCFENIAFHSGLFELGIIAIKPSSVIAEPNWISRKRPEDDTPVFSFCISGAEKDCIRLDFGHLAKAYQLIYQ